MWAVPRLCEFYPDICLTTEEKAQKNLSQGKRNLSQVKKNLSQSTVYILPKHPHIKKLTQTHTYSQSLGLDGPGIESRWVRDFPHPYRPALKPTQPPIHWVPGLYRG